MLVKNKAHVFPGASTLPLSGVFLPVLVWDLKNRLRMADGRTHPVATGQVSFVAGRQIAGRRMVGEIFEHRRI